ncbi:MAG TPA: ATP-binding protein [Ktedonobacteraceae bacterium]|nr:ATP-binding protein [Ktedonobacteraceae bacterium]
MQRADEVYKEKAPGQSCPLHEATLISLSGEENWKDLLIWLDIAPDALVLVDRAGCIARVNSQAEALFGYTHSELEGQTLEVLLPERFRAVHLLHREHFAASPRTRPMGASLELYGKRKDGSEFPTDISLRPLLFDGKLYVLGAIRDLSERKALETREHAAREAAEARLALLQHILDELPTGVSLVQGEEARLILSNRTAAALWGAEWLPGQPALDFLAASHIHLCDPSGQALPPPTFVLLRALREGTTIHQQQEIICRADGTNLPVLVNAVTLSASLLAGLLVEGESHDIADLEPAALVVHQDITPLKEVEHLKDHFLGFAAHELRTPLAVLKGFVTMLLTRTEHFGSVLADWQREALVEIEQATGHLDRLAEELIEVARLQAGRLILHRECLDLVSFCQRIVTQMKQSTDGQRHQLRFSTFPPTLPHLMAEIDGERIEQVLTNILTNAIKYSPAGGQIEVMLQQRPERQEALIRIRDQGIGIPQAEQALLFGRFVRASNGKTYGISGTGLGLYLCRELVEQHGGHIWFESTEGAGSTFFLCLPNLV